MASLFAERNASSLEVVDLFHVRPTELTALWQREIRLWRETLDWDVSNAVCALERAVDRRGLMGKAVRHEGRALAYAYFGVEGERGVVSGLVVSPLVRGTEAGSAIVKAVLADLEKRGVRRIETQFICFEAPWIVHCFEELGFRAHWRDFLRLPVAAPRTTAGAGDEVVVLPWSAWNLSETSLLMQRAHRGGVDSQMNELYRTSDGCRALLNNIVRQRGCGASLASASAIARTRATDAAVGFALVTEIAPRHGHLAQVAVTPEFQGQGIGRRLIDHTLSRLHELGHETLSLMVSSGNARASRLYDRSGFQSTYRFPVFSRES